MSKTKSMDDYIRETRSYALQFEASGFKKNAEFMYDLADYLKSLPTPAVTDTNVGGKWIPCSERLPDIKEGEYASDCVLVTLKWWDGEISETVGWYNRTGTWSEDGKMSKVIAWMPYEPYKGE